MTGRVNGDNEAIIEVAVRLGETEFRFAAVVDTGFSEFLVLPSDLLAEHGAVAEREEQITLGNGTIALMDVYVVETEWLGGWRSVKAFASEGEALVGMKLLLDCDLFVRVAPGGEVRIEAVWRSVLSTPNPLLIFLATRLGRTASLRRKRNHGGCGYKRFAFSAPSRSGRSPRACGGWSCAGPPRRGACGCS